MNMTKRINVRFSDADFEQIVKQSEMCGISPSEYVRRRALGKMIKSKISYFDKEASLALGKAIGMIKQIFKHELASPDDTHKLLTLAISIMEKIDQRDD